MVKCDADGNVDLDDLQAKAIQYKDKLSALMVTYPSTHGVFEESIAEICDITHKAGGQVYVDGANLNALVGYCAPPHFGADVDHLIYIRHFAFRMAAAAWCWAYWCSGSSCSFLLDHR